MNTVEPDKPYEGLLFTSQDTYSTLEEIQMENVRTQMVPKSGKAVQRDKPKSSRRCSKLSLALLTMVIFLLVANVTLIMFFIKVSKEKSELQRFKSGNNNLMIAYLNSSSQCLRKKGIPEHAFTFLPLGGKMFQNSYYFFSDSFLNWSDSNGWCKIWNSSLVIINNNDEQEFLKNKVAKEKHMVWWIGLTDAAKEGVWKWVDNTSYKPADKNKTHFDVNEPDNKIDSLGNDEDCVFMNSDGKWGDDKCSNLHHWICEKKTDICSP